ncbi:transglutaminaseTgpA domain-containing protein [Brachybacterium kimchii]|uniref:DUF3488 and transglutaminase-like domain-containing protein n=1 Tax=Brachybacterium kimchii TaxID=2942909 RepID=A0ABY4N146_9MICO|nr:DUF3488 and transglutaminase-like domain-containing protein [Brachybacterium kimchii]UQN28251.1 DUF3488 and transglutaminase-like domain-containing protein [Brachybacterium kimchii]
MSAPAPAPTAGPGNRGSEAQAPTRTPLEALRAKLLSGPVRMSLVLAVTVVLAAIPLSQLLDGADWFTLPLGAAVVVGGLGALVRAFSPRRMRALPVQVVGLVLLCVGVEAVTGALPVGGPAALVTGQVDVIRQGVSILFQAQAPLVLAPSSRIVVLALIGLVVLALDILCVEGGWHMVTALILLGFMLVPALMRPDGGGFASIVGPILAALAVLAVSGLPDRSGPRRPRGKGADGGQTADGGKRSDAGQTADRGHGAQSGAAGPAGSGAAGDRIGRRAALGLFGAGAVAVATPAVSAVLPRAQDPVFPIDLDRINAWQGRAGALGGAMIDDSVSVRRNLMQGREREMLRMTTDVAQPGYLRLQALTQFDGQSFQAGKQRGSTSRTTSESFSDRRLASSRPDGDPVYDLHITELIGDRLPTPFPIRWTDAGDSAELARTGASNGELVVDGGARDLSGMRYSVAVDGTTFGPDELRRVSDADMRIPYDNGYVDVSSTPSIHALATEISQQADSEAAYDVARALAAYFHENFEYSLTVTSKPGENPIDAFLAERVGYCEQFAATFALVMNDLKFPTRVSIGFTAGEVDGDARTITNHHAHAWPETWFGPDHGWVRFEPTPAAADNGVSSPTFASDAPDPDESAEDTPSSEASPAEDTTSADEETTEAETTTEDASSSSESSSASDDGAGPAAVVPWWGWGLGGVGVAGALVGGGALARSGVRRRALAAREQRWAQLDASQAAELAWSDVVRAVDYRAWALHLLGWSRLYGKDPVVLELDAALPPGEALTSLLDYAETAGLEVPDGTREAAARIAAAVTAARYAPTSTAGDATSGKVGAVGQGEAEPEGEGPRARREAQGLREDADAVRAVVLSRGQRRPGSDDHQD